MKIIYITCDITVLEPLLKLLDENKVSSYQVIEQVTAKNIKGAPRFNTPVWPGYNAVVIIQLIEEAEVVSLINRLREFNKAMINEDELITVSTWTMDDYFFD